MRPRPYKAVLLLLTGLVTGTCHRPTTHAVSPRGEACAPPDPHRVAAANLTTEEARMLPDLCWRDGLASQQLAEGNQTVNEGIPSGVSCEAVKWCDGNYCTRVCKRGSVEVDPWLRNAVQTQLKLTRRLPLCMATLLGSHNSGITLADGYGNLDPQYQDYFQWIRYVANDARLRTSNQWLSLTDQLNLGVRGLELDTHWVEGELRIAHCGGLQVPPLNLLINTLNVVAKLLGHPIHWDTETVGCNPSLSSLPVRRQRSFASALAELRAWLDRPENQQEFLVIYLDDQLDLLAWGKVPELITELVTAFPPNSIYTPAEHALRHEGGWPSIDELATAGKQLIVVSAAELGPSAAGLIFDRKAGDVCGWTEPSLRTFLPYPDCALFAPQGVIPLPTEFQTLSGTLLRVSTCELSYGPFNCEFLWSSDNQPLLDEATLPAVSQCGVNQPCPDSITPERVAATIWSWAPDEPPSLPAADQGATRDGVHSPLHRRSWAQSGEGVGSWVGRWLQRVWMLVRGRGPQVEVEERRCAAVSRHDGRWRAVPCTADLPKACRTPLGLWAFSPAGKDCPRNSTFAVPRHAKENAGLQRSIPLVGGTHPLERPSSTFEVGGAPIL